MADGSIKNIEDIDKNDLVKSCNLMTGEIVNKKVTKTFANPASKGLVEIKFSNGTKNNNTVDHRYFVANKGWCAVKPNPNIKLKSDKLIIGDKCLILIAGELQELEVTNITLKPNLKKKTYNITVEGTECYFANSILVHNRY